MTRLLLSGVSCLILATLVSGCGWMDDDEGWFVNPQDDYLDARQLPPLSVPGDLASQDLADPFPIPAVPNHANPQYFPERPPLPNALYADDSRREVRIQRLGERRWLVIPEPPNTVWPKLKQFLAENGMNVVSESPTHGRIDTAWFEVTDHDRYRDVVRVVVQEGRRDVGLVTGQERLRLKLEQGLQQDTSEIHLRHENDSMAAPTPPGLVSFTGVDSAVPQLEEDLLNEVGAYIASRVSEQTVSKVATNIAGAAKATIDRNAGGQPILRLRLDRGRAWAAIGRALETGAVEITSSDADAGVYNVRVSDELFAGGEPPGFFGRLLGRGGSRTHDLSLQLGGQAEDLELTVLRDDGTYAERQLSQDVLNLVREYAG